jgi:ATP-dependent Clp protease ATP-binding subunit ClpA
MTSNLGAKEMMRELRPKFGFEAGTENAPSEVADKVERVGMAAVRRKFPPEFVNRIDVVITYKPLDSAALDSILDQQVHDLERHVEKRLAAGAFQLDLDQDSRAFLLAQGTSTEYGARELKRVVHRHLTQPIATSLARGEIGKGGLVRVTLDPGGSGLMFRPDPSAQPKVSTLPALAASAGAKVSEMPKQTEAGKTRTV